MGKSKKEDGFVKQKPAKVYSRAQAERALTAGTVKPDLFLDMSDPLKKPDPKNPGATRNHANYHVRNKAWKMMGKPVPEGWSLEDQAKFYDSIHYKPGEAAIAAAEDVTT